MNESVNESVKVMFVQLHWLLANGAKNTDPDPGLQKYADPDPGIATAMFSTKI